MIALLLALGLAAMLAVGLLLWLLHTESRRMAIAAREKTAALERRRLAQAIQRRASPMQWEEWDE